MTDDQREAIIRSLESEGGDALKAAKELSLSMRLIINNLPILVQALGGTPSQVLAISQAVEDAQFGLSEMPNTEEKP